MANFFSKLLGDSAGSLVEAIGNAIDKTVTSDEERKALDNELERARLDYELEMARLGVDEKRALLADVDSARVNQSRVQEAANASWLAKNVQPLLAVAIIGLTFFMYWQIIFGAGTLTDKDSAMRDVVIYVLGALTTVATQVVSYFFGSSQGSADKSLTIKDMARRESDRSNRPPPRQDGSP